MQKKAFFFAGALLCLVVAAWAFYQYQKPRATAAQFSAAYTLSAEQLYREYSHDESAADKKYGNQVIQVIGKVGAVQTTAQGINVLLDGGGSGGVNCSFEKGNQTPPAPGKRLVVKGRCTGFLMDVNLVDAVEVTN